MGRLFWLMWWLGPAMYRRTESGGSLGKCEVSCWIDRYERTVVRIVDVVVDVVVVAGVGRARQEQALEMAVVAYVEM